MTKENLARTPLYSCHVELGARMVPFAGYEMPVQYTGVLEETRAVRESCGLFDVSHMGQFSLKGTGALSALERLVTNDVQKMGRGQAQYNMLCNEAGGVIDDLVVYRRSETEIFLCVNASNRHEDFAWVREHLGTGSDFVDQSDATALLALQGPKSEEILQPLCPKVPLNLLKYYWATEGKFAEFPCYFSRTGYTGEDGFELYVANEHAAAVWQRLLEVGRKHGLIPCGLGARDSLRLEMGYPLHGHELSKGWSPLAAGLGWVVKLSRPVSFIGQKTLQEESARGPEKVLKAFVIQDRRIARQGYPIVLEDKTKVGEITSGTFSPHLNCPIALGFVSKAHVGANQFFAEVRNDAVPMTLAKLPFVKPRTKR
jgi:aminomethyltransferase